MDVQKVHKSARSLIEGYTVKTVKFSANRDSLSQLVSETHGFIEVKNRHTGDFLAVSHDSMNAILDEIIVSHSTRASFFDGMEEFNSGETVSYSDIARMNSSPPEYTKEDLKKLNLK